MFAYCGNNPENCSDSSGHAYQGIYSQIHYNEHDHTYGGLRENFYTLPEETFLSKVEKYIKNKVRSIDLKSPDVTFYNSTLVVYHSSEYLTSWAIFGIIFLNRNSDNETTLAHEYGHILQERRYGTAKYFVSVFVPSTLYNIASRSIPILDDNYYNMPWEYDAEVNGKVDRDYDYANWAELGRWIYFAMREGV